MKLNDKQKNIIVDLINNEVLKYKTHGLKIDQKYASELETIKEKMIEKTPNFEKKLYEDMCKHSEREDW
jgi:hypothetical protein